jgi:uncharacterized membrane protein
MIRTVFYSAVLFLLPFVFYFLWLGSERRKSEEEIAASKRHLFFVTLAGIALAAAGFIYFTEFGGADPDAVWVPPVYKDGQLVPGHFAPREGK